MTVSFSTVKTIQIRCVMDGTSWNKRYVRAADAASDYTTWKMEERRKKKWNEAELGAAYHRQTQADLDHEYELSDRFIRFMTMVFKRMLAN